jgi:membrane fusion protein, multidrug efflux system
MKKAPIQIVVVLGIVALAAYWLMPQEQKTANQHAARPPVPVIVHEVGYAEFVERIEAIGTLKANESVTLTAHVRETVTRVNFEDGQTVQKGDILLEFTNEEEGALLAEARANLSEAEKQLERVKDLVTRGNATQARLDQQVREATSARARVNAIAARMDDRLLRAPFAGILGFRMVSAGTLVDPGSPVTTLDDIAQVKLDFSVPETYLGALRPGQQIRAASVAYRDRAFEGVVTTIGSRVDPVSRAVTVRAIIANDDNLLRPGMLVTVELERSRKQEIMIPEEALVPRQRNQYVYVVNADNQVEERQVYIAGRRPGAVVVTSGLQEGEVIINEGTSRVVPGSAVVEQSRRLLADQITKQPRVGTSDETL